MPRASGSAPSPARRLRRRVLNTLLALLTLAVVAPAAAFLVGWMLFDLNEADATPVTQVVTFARADGSPLATVRPDNVNRTIVSLADVPDHVEKAVLSAEDRSFYSNRGFDLVGIGRALWNQATGGVGGGSTVTQQYIKVSTGQDDASLLRKYKEVVLAVKISQKYGKDEILERYLNIIYFGRGAYGVQAAAQAYFGKDVKDLSVSEGAVLAGTIQAPSRWDKGLPPTADERWNFVLDGMVTQGWLPAPERAVAQFPAVKPPVGKKDEDSGAGVPGAEPDGHIYNLAQAELKTLPIAEEDITTRGVTVTLTIDPKRQEEAVKAVTKELKKAQGSRNKVPLRGALVAVDPSTGAILAYYGGDNGLGTDYAQAQRQPGSSFKPFVLSAALQDGRQSVGLGSIYDGSSPQDFLGVTVDNSEGFSCARCSVQTAMTQSVNTVFYKMGIDAGPQRVADAAHQAGIPETALPGPTAGIALGDKEVRPIDMASAFATFAADGMRREPYVISKVTTDEGRTLLWERPPGGLQAVPQQVARNVTEAMRDVPKGEIAIQGQQASAGKTGTVQHPTKANQNKDAWMVGYTPSVSTAVWVGTDTSEPIVNAAGRPMFGRMVPGAIWQAFMNSAARNPAEQFSPFVPLGTPPGSLPEGDDDEESDDESDGDSDGDSDEDSDGGSDGGSDDDSNGDSGSGDGRSSRGSGDGDDSGDGSSGRSGGSDESSSEDSPTLFTPDAGGLSGLRDE